MGVFGSIASGLGLRVGGAPGIQPLAQGDGGGRAPSEMPIDQQLEFIFGENSDRTKALRVGALYRCVTLIASTVSELIANTAHVVDFDRTRLESQPVDLLHLIRSSPDDEISGLTYLEDLMMDLLLEGNALAVIERGPGGQPRRLKRMMVRTAQVVKKKGRLLYYGEIAGPMEKAAPGYVDSKSVVHARWADSTGRDCAPTRSNRAGFAVSPLEPLADDLLVSREIVRWIAKFYDTKGGSLKSDHAVIYPDPVAPKEQDKVIESLAKYALTRSSMVLFGNPRVESLKTLPQDAETSNLRDQEIENIGRVYGIPPPLMGLHVTQWGSGISELTRLYWKFAGRPAMNRLLQPLSLRLLPRGQEFAVSEIEMLRGDMAALTSLITATRGQGGEPPILGRQEQRSMIGVDTPFPEEDEPEREPPPAPPAPPEPDAPPPEEPPGEPPENLPEGG